MKEKSGQDLTDDRIYRIRKQLYLLELIPAHPQIRLILS